MGALQPRNRELLLIAGDESLGIVAGGRESARWEKRIFRALFTRILDSGDTLAKKHYETLLHSVQ